MTSPNTPAPRDTFTVLVEFKCDGLTPNADLTSAIQAVVQKLGISTMYQPSNGSIGLRVDGTKIVSAWRDLKPLL